MQIQDIPAGESWACRFRTTTFVDSEGEPIDPHVQVGEAHPGSPGEYESIGVIQVRDQASELVQLQCIKTLRQFTVSFAACWDLDTVEWLEETPADE